MEGPGYIWRFDQDAYEKELATAWKEEEEEKNRSSETSIAPRRSERPKSIASGSGTIQKENENEAVEKDKLKMADPWNQELSEDEEDGNDYTWSDVVSMASNNESDNSPPKKKRNGTQEKEQGSSDDAVRNWLVDRADMNETIVEAKKEMEGHWSTMQKSLEELNQRMSAMETKKGQENIVSILEEKLMSTRKELANDVKGNICGELEEAFKRMERRWEVKLEEAKTQLEGRTEKKGAKKAKAESEEPHQGSPNIATVEKYLFQEMKMEKALNGIPKFDGTEAKFHTWRKRITNVIDKYSFLEKESYEKYQMLVDRMTEEAAELIKDIEELEEKPFESALDRLDRQYLLRSPEERIVAKLSEFAKMDSEEKEKWKKVKLYLESLEAGYSEEVLKWMVTIIVVIIFDRKLEESWQIERLRKKESSKLEAMKEFLEQVYIKTLEKQAVRKGEIEKRFRCYLCGKKHSLKCEAFAFLTRQERLELVKEKMLCFNCLKPGHVAEECRRQKCKCGELKNFRIHSCKKYYVMSVSLRGNQTLTQISVNNTKLVAMPDLGANISIISQEAVKKV